MSLTTNELSAAGIAAVCGNNRGGSDGFGWGLTVPSSFGNILLPNN